MILKFFRIVISIVLSLITTLVGLIVLAPLGLFWPRNKKLVIFLADGRGLFQGNVKYLFLYAVRNHKDYSSVFVTSNPQSAQELKRVGLSVLFHPSVEGYLCCLRASIVISDTNSWIHGLRFFLFFGAKKIQLWHGVGFKKLGFSWSRFFRLHQYYELMRDIREFLVKYDIFVSTSQFYIDNVFKGAFRAKHFVDSGYPRNDIVGADCDNLDLIGVDSNCLELMREAKKKGKKVVFYAPTFREYRSTLVATKAINLDSLLNRLKDLNALLIIKAHPNESGIFEKWAKNVNDSIVIYDPWKDPYPTFRYTDVLITDYSSIYSDYLFLDKPIIFFCFDLVQYAAVDRQIQFDYETFTPGTKCLTQTELENEIADVFAGRDKFVNERQVAFARAFTYRDNKAAKRVWDIILSTNYSAKVS